VTRFSSLLLLLPGLALASAAADVPDTYRTSASEVRITFFATDQNNRPVPDIREDDFAVVDDGVVIRDFRSLLRSGESTLDVVVLVDVSESVAPQFQATINEVRELVARRQIARADNISVVSFGGVNPIVICSHGCRNPAAEQRLLSVKAGGPTPLFDALLDGANLFATHPNSGVRPLLILFSDGDDTISRTPGRDALQAVIASGALLYAIDLNKIGASAGSAALQQMAEATGGRYFSSRKGAGNALQAALADLHASYVVSYQLPSHAAGFHSLRILPKHDQNLGFHCRNGYYYEPIP
jgi:Ca-activated chloride channel homolog